MHYSNLQPLWRLDNQKKGGVKRLDVIPKTRIQRKKIIMYFISPWLGESLAFVTGVVTIFFQLEARN